MINLLENLKNHLTCGRRSSFLDAGDTFRCAHWRSKFIFHCSICVALVHGTFYCFSRGFSTPLKIHKCHKSFHVVPTSAEKGDKVLQSFRVRRQGPLSLTSFRDWGGLLYLWSTLFFFAEAAEDTFTLWFSWHKLHKDSPFKMTYN